MSKNTKNIMLARKQSGAVLVMALILLTVLTLIGVTSMSTSTLELKVASNMQQSDIAFQAGQAIIHVLSIPDDPVGANPLNTISYQLFQTDKLAVGFTQNLAYAGLNGNATATAAVTWLGCKSQTGSSLEAGKAPVNNFFNARVIGQTATSSSTSVQMQGVRYYAAACQL